MNQFGQRIQFGFGGGLTPVVKKLLIANFAVYILQWITLSFGSPLIKYFALVPAQVTSGLAFWQLVTYQFLHNVPGVFHILFNMFALWMFGCEVERALGSKQFLKYYLFTGIGAGIFFILFNWNSITPVIGASGAIYGVLAAFAILFPDRIITLLLFFVFPVSIKAKYLVAILVGISVFAGMQGALFGTTEHVAHLAHLGGALVGFLLLKGDFLTKMVAGKAAEQQLKRRASQKMKKNEAIRKRQQDVDDILDRINEVGYDNISDKEKTILKDASEYLKREQGL